MCSVTAVMVMSRICNIPTATGAKAPLVCSKLGERAPFGHGCSAQEPAQQKIQRRPCQKTQKNTECHASPYTGYITFVSQSPSIPRAISKIASTAPPVYARLDTAEPAPVARTIEWLTVERLVTAPLANSLADGRSLVDTFGH